MSVKKDLQIFYDKNAKKYYETRKKIRHDGKRILDEIKKYKSSKKIEILELACGGGRFCSFLHKNFNGKFKYTGVDLSQNLLDLAKKDNPKDTFICDDMINFVKKVEQEKYDFIVITAGFQHIPTEKERIILSKYFYKILKYNGKLIMLNRTFSDRFKKKYKKEVKTAFWKQIITLGKMKINDVFVPWKEKNITYFRYYHLFKLKELEYLAKIAGFSIECISYLDKSGKKVNSTKYANNSLIIASKKIIDN